MSNTSRYSDFLYHNTEIPTQQFFKEFHSILNDDGLSDKGKVEMLHELDFYHWSRSNKEEK